MPKLKTKKESDVVKSEEEKKEQSEGERQSLNEDQEKRLDAGILKASKAKEQRDKRREELDNMTYEEDYYTNKQAANSYLRPKMNDDEVRIVTGTTEKRIEVLSNEVLSINLQPEVIAYSGQDAEIKNLGRDMMDVVNRTGDMENEEDFWQDYLRELLTQRIAYYEDVVEIITIGKQKFTRIRKKLINGLRIYMGDMNIPARNFQTDQPYIVKYSRMGFDQASSIYKDINPEVWKFVKPGAFTGNLEVSPFYYRMNDLDKDEVEILEIFDPLNNEYEIIINSVLLFDEPKELPYNVLPNRRYNISAVIIKSTDTDLCLGKPPVSSAKTLQALDDEIIRNLVRKFRQALEPPIGVKKKSGLIYSKDIWEAGSVTQGVSSDDFDILNPENKGVTNSEFAMAEFINKKTEEFIGAGILQSGIQGQGEQTATEVSLLQRNAMKNLGHIVAAFMRAKRDAPYLRIYNILENFDKPVARLFNSATQQVENVYQRFTIDNATLPSGKRGKKIVQFMDRDLTEEEKSQIFAEEQEQEENGKIVRFRAINIKKLASIAVFWHIVVTQQEREGSALSKVLFKDQLAQAVAVSQITGKKINPDKLTEEFEFRWQVKDMFQEQAPQPQQVAEGDDILKEIEGFERTQAGSELTEGVRGSTQKPSINELNRQQ